MFPISTNMYEHWNHAVVLDTVHSYYVLGVASTVPRVAGYGGRYSTRVRSRADRGDRSAYRYPLKRLLRFRLRGYIRGGTRVQKIFLMDGDSDLTDFGSKLEAMIGKFYEDYTTSGFVVEVNVTLNPHLGVDDSLVFASA